MFEVGNTAYLDMISAIRSIENGLNKNKHTKEANIF